LNRVVAIKVMAPELAANPMAVKRFLREAQAAAAVSHDHVVTIHAIHEDNRPPLIVMEFIDGLSLQDKIQRHGALPLKEILRIGMQTADGLAAASRQGLVHRDIKPANILLENGIERVKITDFGLARAADDVGVTQTGQIAGTPQFMSPEQAQGQPLDARSDLFSLGSVLYTMCTGRPPFRADSALAMMRRVTDDTPRSIREINPDIPDWLEAIVFKLLAKDPHDRLQTSEEVAELLSRHLAHLQDPHRVPPPAAIGCVPRAAEDELSFVATTLRVYGWISLGWVALTIVLATIARLFPGNAQASFPVWAVLAAAISVVTGGLALAGLRCVTQRDSWAGAVAGNIAALLPANPALLCAVPWSIASLFKLGQPHVRRAFTSRQTQALPSGNDIYSEPKLPLRDEMRGLLIVRACRGNNPWVFFPTLGACVIIGLGMLGYALTNYGTLTIESANEKLEIMITRPIRDTHDGMHVHVVERIKGSGKIRLWAGHYRLIPDMNRDVAIEDFQLSREQFVLGRNDEMTVRVMRRLNAENKRP
jgi:hypothetical protein